MSRVSLLLLLFVVFQLTPKDAFSGETGQVEATQCIGVGDPKNDFYIKDLENKIKRVQDIPKEIDALKEQNKIIDSEIAEIERKVSSQENTNKLMVQVQNRYLQSRSASTAQRYESWKTEAERKVKAREDKIRSEKTKLIDGLTEKAKEDTRRENDRYRRLFSRLIAESDARAAAYLAEYNRKTKQYDEANQAEVKALEKSVDTDISSQLAVVSEAIWNKNNEYHEWRKQQLEFIRAKQRDAKTFAQLDEIKLLDEAFKKEDASRKSALDAEIAKIPALPGSIKDAGVLRIKPQIDQVLAKLKTQKQLAKDEYDAAFLENASKNKLRLEEERKIHTANLDRIEAIKITSIGAVEQKAESALSGNSRLFETKDKEVRDKLSREYADAVISVQKNAQALEAVIEGYHKQIEELKSTQLANIKKYSEDLPNELEKLKFISLWIEESPLFKSEAGVCTGDCEREPTKASFQLSSKNIDQRCIEKALAGKAAFNTEVKCDNSKSPRQETKKQCIDKKIADYIGWSLNKAIDCLSGPFNTIDTQLTFIKIANESTFRPFYSYIGGHGIAQTVQIAQNEMLGFSGRGWRASGRRFLAETMAKSSNRQLCEKYKGIFDYDAEYRFDKMGADYRAANIDNYRSYFDRLFTPGEEHVCQFISLDEGIHRSILNGLGLYLYYKDGYQDGDKDGVNDQSSDEAMKKIGITRSNPNYQRMKEYFTLAMYGPKGPGGAIAQLASNKARMFISEDTKGKQVQKNPNNLTFDEFKKNLIKVFPYLSAIDKTQKDIADKTNGGERLECATQYY